MTTAIRCWLVITHHSSATGTTFEIGSTVDRPT